MAKKEEINLIVDYALENDDLATALKIGSAYDEIRKTIIISFIKRLESALKDILDPEWIIIENELKQITFQNYECFFLSKEHWRDDYRIGIESQNKGAKNFVIGVRKNEKKPHMQGDKLKNQLDQVCGTGKANKWWEWYRYIEGTYRNWGDNEEALIKMHNSDEPVTYFKDYIKKIIDVATPVIDEALSTLNEA